MWGKVDREWNHREKVMYIFVCLLYCVRFFVLFCFCFLMLWLENRIDRCNYVFKHSPCLFFVVAKQIFFSEIRGSPLDCSLRCVLQNAVSFAWTWWFVEREKVVTGSRTPFLALVEWEIHVHVLLREADAISIFSTRGSWSDIIEQNKSRAYLFFSPQFMGLHLLSCDTILVTSPHAHKSDFINLKYNRGRTMPLNLLLGSQEDTEKQT